LKAEAKRKRIIETLAKGLAVDKRWRGWEFWKVTTHGHRDPIDVAENWTICDVLDEYYALQIKGLVQ